LKITISVPIINSATDQKFREHDMRIGKLTLAILTACAISLAGANAHADWYDGGIAGMGDRAMVMLADWWVCGWGGCD